jgi:hypothetical protein
VSHTGASLPSTSSNGSLNAFAGVPTAAVSQVELNAVSGEGFWSDLWYRLTKGRKNPACFTSKAYCH